MQQSLCREISQDSGPIFDKSSRKFIAEIVFYRAFRRRSLRMSQAERSPIRFDDAPGAVAQRPKEIIVVVFNVHCSIRKLAR